MRASLLIAALCLCGCRSPLGDAIGQAEARTLRDRESRTPRTERVVVRHPVTKEVLEDRTIVLVDGVEVGSEGVQRTYYPDGSPETLRSFANGKPTGIWWSWWATGALRSAYVFDPKRATRMTWWHANGFTASDGYARNGSRVGPWRFWYENGELESEGEFVGGRRQGAWTFYDEEGEWVERGRFVRGVRAGEWEQRDPRR